MQCFLPYLNLTCTIWPLPILFVLQEAHRTKEKQNPVSLKDYKWKWMAWISVFIERQNEILDWKLLFTKRGRESIQQSRMIWKMIHIQIYRVRFLTKVYYKNIRFVFYFINENLSIALKKVFLLFEAFSKLLTQYFDWQDPN